MAKISVIIPCYNVEKYIDRCIESVVRQTIGVAELEIICVDDCSTDGTLAKLMDWEKRFPDNFIIVESPQNGRQGQARNIGLSYASADWIAFVDSDDWIALNYLEVLYGYAATGKYEVVCCGHVRDRGENDSLDVEEVSGGEIKEYQIQSIEERKKLILRPELKYNAWGKLINRSLLIDNALQFPENLTYEDVFWGSLLHLVVNSAVVLPAKLYHYFANDDSTVLAKNQYHHLDCITIQDMLWDAWNARGFIDKYPDELQLEFVYSGYLTCLKMLILRFEEPNYNGYLLLRHLSLKKIPGFEENPYIKSGILREEHKLALVSLKNQLNKKQFMDFAQQLRKIGI